MLENRINVLVCVLCFGTATSSYIKSFVDMYRTMAPITSLPPLTISGLTDDEKQSLDGGLNFASGLSGMGSELLVTGAKNASDVVHHGLQSALHFAETAVVEGSKLASHGLDILEEIEQKAPHYAGSVRNVVPLVGSRSLNDVRTDVTSLHSKIIPALQQVVGNSHVVVDKVSQFVQTVVNVMNDIIQIAISLAKMAVTGDIGEIEKYEKDLMLRTTGTTDPGLASSRIIQALDPKTMRERVTSLATAYKHISSSAGTFGKALSNYVTGTPAARLSLEENSGGIFFTLINLPFKGIMSIMNAVTGIITSSVTGGTNSRAVHGGSIVDYAGKYKPAEYWNSSGGDTVTGDQEVISKKQDGTGIIEGKNVEPPDVKQEDGLELKAPVVVIGDTQPVSSSGSPDGNLSTTSGVDAKLPDGGSTSVNRNTIEIMTETAAGDDSAAERNISADIVLPKGSNQGTEDVARAKSDETDNSWSYLGMVVDAIKNTVSSIKNAVVGDQPEDAPMDQDGVQNGTNTRSASDSLDDIISGARGLQDEDKSSEKDDSQTSTGVSGSIHNTSRVDPGDKDEMNSSKPLQVTKPEDAVQMTETENSKDMLTENSAELTSEISTGPPHNPFVETTDHEKVAATEYTETNKNTTDSRKTERTPGYLERITPRMEKGSLSDMISDARDVEGNNLTTPSGVATSTSSSLVMEIHDQISSLTSASLVTEGTEGEIRLGAAEAVTNSGTLTPMSSDVKDGIIPEAQTTEQETIEGKETLSEVHLAKEHNSGAQELAIEQLPESQNHSASGVTSVITNQTEQSNGLGFFGQFVQFVGKVANKAAQVVVDTVGPEGEKFIENLAHNVSKAVIESVTPEDQKLLENLPNNITNTYSGRDENDTELSSMPTRGDPSDIITGARGLDLDHEDTSTYQVNPITAETAVSVGDGTLSKYQENSKQTTNPAENLQQYVHKVEEQFPKPGNAEQVTPGFENDSPAGIVSGARSLFDEDVDHDDSYTMVSNTTANNITSFSGVNNTENEESATIVVPHGDLIVALISEEHPQEAYAAPVVTTGTRMGITGNTATTSYSVPEPSAYPGTGISEILDSPESIISGARGLEVGESPASNTKADLPSFNSDPNPLAIKTFRDVENEVLNAPESIISGARGLELDNAHSFGDGASSHITGTTSPEHGSSLNEVKNEGFDSAQSNISGAHNSTGPTNVPLVEETFNGTDIFGKKVQLVGTVANSASTAAVETIAPESVKFVENLARNVTKAVVEGVASEVETTIGNLASNITQGVVQGEATVNTDSPPRPAIFQSEGMISGARGLDAEDVNGIADSGATVTSKLENHSYHNAPTHNEAFDLQKKATSEEKPENQLLSEDNKQKIEDSASHPTDGGWIFVNVVSSKPQLFYAPEGLG